MDSAAETKKGRRQIQSLLCHGVNNSLRDTTKVDKPSPGCSSL
jgi:hypothetical protein